MQVPQPPESGLEGLVAVARAEWPFAGRDEEFHLITTAIGADPTGRDERGGQPPETGARGTVIFAPAGVGKTRLLTEVRRWAEDRGVRTELVIATEAAARTPYGAVLHLLPAGTAEPADRVTWHATFSAALRSPGHRTLLLVDDAQHLDHGSAALVLQLTIEGTVTPVVGVRRGAPLPDPITTLWKNGLALRVDLQPFSTVEMRDLISRSLGGAVSARTLSRLAAVSDGNVLYARELVAGALDAQSLRVRDGVWTWDEQVVLAPRLVDAVGWRLAALSDDQRRALALVAVGEPLPLQVAETLVAEETLSVLEEAVLVCIDGNGEDAALRLCHPLYGEVVLGQLGQLTRRRLVMALADALEANPRHRDEAVVRVASWRLETGGELSPETLLRAAERANQTFDHELAERLGRAGLATVDPTDSDLRCALVVELARALVWCNRLEEAHTMLVGTEDQVLASADRQLQHAYLDARYWASFVGLGRAAETNRLLDRYPASSGTDEPGARAGEGAGEPGLAAYRANILLGQGMAREAVALAEPLLDSTEVTELQRLLALETSGEALGYLGLHRRAAQVWDRMRELAATGRGRTTSAAAEADLQELWCAQLDGRFGEILPTVAAVHARLENSPDVVTRGLASLSLGRILMMAGQPGRAQTILLDAVADFRRVNLGGSLAWGLALVSQAAALTGRPADARRWRDEARERPVHGGARQAADLTAADVWVAVASGDTSAACALALEGAAAYPQLELPRARLLHLAVRVGERGASVAADLRDIADRVECDYPELLADHAEALRAGAGPALESVAHRFGDRGLPLLAAEAASQASRAHRAAGSTDGTRRASALLATLTARFEPITTPALREPELLADLSRRELDVARLAALGLSNAQIAERLVVSVRTVESHLYQAYAKLGVDRRTELARLLPPQ